MSRAFKNRQKAIKRAKAGRKTIPRDEFMTLQASWRKALDGPFIGTLADVLRRDSR